MAWCAEAEDGMKIACRPREIAPGILGCKALCSLGWQEHAAVPPRRRQLGSCAHLAWLQATDKMQCRDMAVEWSGRCWFCACLKAQARYFLQRKIARQHVGMVRCTAPQALALPCPDGGFSGQIRTTAGAWLPSVYRLDADRDMHWKRGWTIGFTRRARGLHGWSSGHVKREVGEALQCHPGRDAARQTMGAHAARFAFWCLAGDGAPGCLAGLDSR